MNKIRVLQVVSSMDRGGAETFLMNVLRAIDKNKFEFIFLCYGRRKFDYENEISSLGARIIRMPNAYNVFRIIKIIKTNNINAVHAHTMFGSVYAMVAARLSGVRIRLLHSHNTMTKLDPRLSRKIYYRISGFLQNKISTKRLACSEDAGTALFGVNSFEVIYNGIELPDFYFNEENRNDIRRSLGIDENVNVIGHVGRFDRVKNHSFLLDVFKAYHDVDNTSILVIIGGGELQLLIEQRIKELNLSESVMLLGKRDDVNRINSALDVFLLPSFHEGLPVVLVEAQASGVYCLVSASVAEEARLTPKLDFLSLDAGVDKWVTSIKRGLQNSDRSVNPAHLVKYDIHKTVAYISRIYEGLQ